MYIYLFFIILGILLYILLNNYNTFSVGIPTWDEWRNWLSSFVCNGPVVDEVDEVDETLTEGDVFIFNYNDLERWYQDLINLPPTILVRQAGGFYDDIPNPNRPNRQMLDQLGLNENIIAGWLTNHHMLRLSNDNQLYGYVRNIGITNGINTVRAEMFTGYDVDAMENYLRDRLTLSERRLALAQIGNTEVNGELVDLPDDVMQMIVDYLPNPQLPTLTIPIERLYDNRDYTFRQNLD